MKPFLIVPIAPSGSGKSTLYTSLEDVNPNLYHFSWDLLRLKWYSPDYGLAWQMYQRDPTFFDRALGEFKKALVRRNDIYVDNMNLTVESRAQFVKNATIYGYRKIAYYFNVSFDVLFYRHASMRAKNKVRLSAYDLMTQVNKQTYPVEGEFDEIVQLDWIQAIDKYTVGHVA